MYVVNIVNLTNYLLILRNNLLIYTNGVHSVKFLIRYFNGIFLWSNSNVKLR